MMAHVETRILDCYPIVFTICIWGEGGMIAVETKEEALQLLEGLSEAVKEWPDSVTLTRE